MKIRKLTSSITLLSLAASAAYGQTAVSPLDEIVVVANRLPISAKQLGTSLSVLTETEITSYGNSSITDVLRQLPAISVSRNGGAGSTASLRIRGEEGFRTLMFFDGLKLSDPSGTQVQTQSEHILSSGIDRIEVLRGPQGLSFGADAGGVINITSKTGSGPLKGNIDTHVGGFGTNQVSANLGGGNDSVDFYLSGSSFQTQGFNSREADSVLMDDDGYDNETFHGRVGANLSDNWRVDLVHRNVDSETQYDGCFSTTTIHDCDSSYELQASRIQARYTSQSMTHSFAYSNTDSDRAFFAAGTESFTAQGELERWEYIGKLNDLGAIDLIFGVDLEEESNNGISRDNTGYYVEALSDFSDSFFLTAGLRRDDNDDFGEHTSYRVSGAYLIDLGSNDTLKLKVSTGTGFRAPSPGEIAYNAGPFAFPPASLVNLSEEKSKGYELGVEYYAGTKLKLEAVYFDQEVEDAITFDLAGFTGYVQDVGTSSSEGVELSGEYALTSNWLLKANYTFNETEMPDGSQRILRPEQLMNVGGSYLSDDGRFSFNAFYRGSADTIDSATALEDFEVLDINARFRINEHVEIYARIENAFDEEYQEIASFFSADRASYIGVKLDF